ncbi:MAG: YoaK family protein [Paracoccus sp. (in: a-proteobacteria)]
MKTRRRLARPIRSARAIVARRRSTGSDLILATILAAIAGAANAGGFFALGQYTSHMTGYLSYLADNIAILNLWIAAISAMAIAAFIAGAGFSALLIHWARSHGGRQQYAWPLVIQGAALGCFSMGGLLGGEVGRVFSLACLCFIMGMQNATITKISGARIRTTHATGMVTDIGIEMGRAVFGRLRPGCGVAADRAKLRILLQLVGAFLLGGIFGAIGYGLTGFLFSIPLAAVLLALGLPGVIDNSARRRRS